MSTAKKSAKTNIKIKDLKTRKNPRGGLNLTTATALNAMQSGPASGLEGGLTGLTSVKLNKTFTGTI